MAITNRIEYLHDVKQASVNFIKTLNHGGNIIPAVQSLAYTINDDEASPVDLIAATAHALHTFISLVPSNSNVVKIFGGISEYGGALNEHRGQVSHFPRLPLLLDVA